MNVFYQKIKWLNQVPYPDGNIKVAEWSKFQNEIGQTENIFQLNCGGLDKSSDFISTSLSSSSIGILANINYDEFSGLSNEVKTKFKKIRPKTLGQALRIDGITPAAVYILLSHVKRKSIKQIA